MFDSIYEISIFLLISIAYWKIFSKCGIKPYWAFIPFAREYHISLCADRELDGRVYTIHSAILYVLMFLTSIIENPMVLALIVK